ncbi:hypothetical protein I7I48_03525 [Histoplasma ohiense]|nr:hypothetical protein I7I48_03525 [Histoplasma ohiense (nom. inval.)]
MHPLNTHPNTSFLSFSLLPPVTIRSGHLPLQPACSISIADHLFIQPCQSQPAPIQHLDNCICNRRIHTRSPVFRKDPPSLPTRLPPCLHRRVRRTVHLTPVCLRLILLYLLNKSLRDNFCNAHQ